MKDNSALLVSARPRAALPGVAAPMSPARYLQLRRRAAGLTVDQAAERLVSAERDRREVRAMIRLLETPGTVARLRATIDTLAEAIPLDPDVYRQIATDPVDRHPPICRGCGCSHNDPCHIGNDHICRMLAGEPAVCTRCTNGEWR
ncbi:hypothetical protein MZO42_06085 [Sphingomonas psychrotolerans]|uniref:HTH cro/C1-type domain-containing protein n=1 Tax=Sphingomonas psychrotolerans TaxID=1327635 RepID=A0ABU3N201_9SPHN|nr:hypothetical protein [Sphingomonas psychrotolerans]MDT8758261.1 hypothetical protein [Sphingomonas psychrotolerans]